MRKRAVHTILLLLIILSVSGSSLVKRRGQRRQDGKTDCDTKIVYDTLTSSNGTEIDPHCDCTLTGLGTVKKIPYAQSSSDCGSVDVQFSSACVRCGMCLAIAEEISDTFAEVHELTPENEWLDDAEATLFLRDICDHSFKHYSLREIDGKRFLSDRMPGAIFVTTSADGLWEKNLRKMCHLYLDEIGETRLYKYWQECCTGENENGDLTTILCRSDVGILRDCRSIEDLEKQEAPSKTFHASMRIIAEHDKYE